MLVSINSITALALFGGFGWQEALVILVVLLLLFGGRKLPELARGLGKSFRELKRAANGLGEDEDEDDRDRRKDDTPEPPHKSELPGHDQEPKNDH